MKILAVNFRREFERISKSVTLTKALFDLTKHPTKGLKSKHPLVKTVTDLHNQVTAIGSNSTFFDGAYLSACAYFELAVRNLIEKYVADVTTKLPNYTHVPAILKDWHAKGCAFLIQNIERDSFTHLTIDIIHGNISKCFTAVGSKPYQFTLEAFSYNERNFRPGVLEDHFSKRIGVDKIWQKLTRQSLIQTHLGTSQPDTLETIARRALETIMQRRNDIIHRGKSYFTAGETEVQDAANYFAVLIDSLAEILDAHLKAL